MNTFEHPVWTIGHSNHSLEAFVELLRQQNITELADVRSAPYSKYTPHFNKDPLQRSLKDLGIRRLGGTLADDADTRST